ncbi:hypothetical protein BDF19DRAFT_433816 [Syncephalis fuscata]|nr:hypothetical protein BDF19DRAFT_433816 [Syncephalis fuscata]
MPREPRRRSTRYTAIGQRGRRTGIGNTTKENTQQPESIETNQPCTNTQLNDFPVDFRITDGTDASNTSISSSVSAVSIVAELANTTDEAVDVADEHTGNIDEAIDTANESISAADEPASAVAVLANATDKPANTAAMYTNSAEYARIRAASHELLDFVFKSHRFIKEKSHSKNECFELAAKQSMRICGSEQEFIDIVNSQHSDNNDQSSGVKKEPSLLVERQSSSLERTSSCINDPAAFGIEEEPSSLSTVSNTATSRPSRLGLRQTLPALRAPLKHCHVSELPRNNQEPLTTEDKEKEPANEQYYPGKDYNIYYESENYSNLLVIDEPSTDLDAFSIPQTAASTASVRQSLFSKDIFKRPPPVAELKRHKQQQQHKSRRDEPDYIAMMVRAKEDGYRRAPLRPYVPKAPVNVYQRTKAITSNPAFGVIRNNNLLSERQRLLDTPSLKSDLKTNEIHTWEMYRFYSPNNLTIAHDRDWQLIQELLVSLFEHFQLPDCPGNWWRGLGPRHADLQDMWHRWASYFKVLRDLHRADDLIVRLNTNDNIIKMRLTEEAVALLATLYTGCEDRINELSDAFDHEAIRHYMQAQEVPGLPAALRHEQLMKAFSIPDERRSRIEAIQKELMRQDLPRGVLTSLAYASILETLDLSPSEVMTDVVDVVPITTKDNILTTKNPTFSTSSHVPTSSTATTTATEEAATTTSTTVAIAAAVAVSPPQPSSPAEWPAQLDHSLNDAWDANDYDIPDMVVAESPKKAKKKPAPKRTNVSKTGPRQLRRSSRRRIAPLAYWRNERQLMTTDVINGQNILVVKDIVRVPATPVRLAAKPKKKNGKLSAKVSD